MSKVDILTAPEETLDWLFKTGYVTAADITAKDLSSLGTNRIDRIFQYIPLKIWNEVVMTTSYPVVRVHIINHVDFKFENQRACLLLAIDRSYRDTFDAALRKNPLSSEDMDAIIDTLARNRFDSVILEHLVKSKNAPWSRVHWEKLTGKTCGLNPPPLVEPIPVPPLKDRLGIFAYFDKSMAEYMLTTGFIKQAEITSDALQNISYRAITKLSPVITDKIWIELLSKSVDGDIFNHVLTEKIVTLPDPFDILRKQKFGSTDTLKIFLDTYPITTEQYIEMAVFLKDKDRPISMTEVIKHPSVPIVPNADIEKYIRESCDTKCAQEYKKRTGVDPCALNDLQSITLQTELADTVKKLEIVTKELDTLKAHIRQCVDI